MKVSGNRVMQGELQCYIGRPHELVKRPLIFFLFSNKFLFLSANQANTHINGYSSLRGILNSILVQYYWPSKHCFICCTFIHQMPISVVVKS